MLRSFILCLLLINFLACSKSEKIYVPVENKNAYQTYKEGLDAFNKNDFFFASKKFSEAELQFKVIGRRNKYFGEWVAAKLNKKDEEIETYVSEVIRADLKEPGDMDLIEKVQKDLNILNDKISLDEIKSKLEECFEKAKKDF